MKKVRSIMFIVMLFVFCIAGSRTVRLEAQVTVKMEAIASTPQQQQVVVGHLECTRNYIPSKEEREFAYRIAFAEAGAEDAMGQTLVINASINNMRARGFSDLIEEFLEPGRYSCVENGYVCVPSGTGKRVVTEDDLTQELKAAVDEAFKKDYTEELLIEAMKLKGLDNPKYYEGGALYFYNPKAISENRAKERENIEVTFKHGRHVFYRYW